MRRFLLPLVCTAWLYATGEVSHYTLNGHDFTVITETYDDYESKGRVAKFYRDERNYDLTYLFAVTLEDKTGTCGARSIEKGAYTIEGNRITLYTRWEREGKAYLAPEGNRIRLLQVDENGTIRQIEGRLYVETMHRGYAKESGMRYLYEHADTPEKKKALEAYIAKTERLYKATFVRDKEQRKALEKEVFDALQQKAKKRWK